MLVRLLRPCPLGDAFLADMGPDAKVDLPPAVAQALIDSGAAEHTTP